MTCKVDSVATFDNPESVAKAVDYFRKHHITKLYLENYRHGVRVGLDVLMKAKKALSEQGFEVCGCITTTMMSERKVEIWPVTTCFSDPAAHTFLKEITEDAAKAFDTIILDDFFFACCECPDCIKDKGDRSWADARAEQMLEIGKKYVIEPARAVNPAVKIIIKYPCWYEHYRSRGYDIIRESELFDAVWTGTETRDPESLSAGRIPQTQASFIMNWINTVAKEKSQGAWYDPIDTHPVLFLEQARQTITGGAKESLLHCYDYLGSGNPGIAIHGTDTTVSNGYDDAEAFRLEASLLADLAEILADAEPFGVEVPRNPSADAVKEIRLQGFLGMLGLAVVPVQCLNKNAKSLFLTYHAKEFEGIADFVSHHHAKGTPFVITRSLADEISFKHRDDSAFGILDVPSDMWELASTLNGETLDTMRNMLLAVFGVKFNAPSRVSLQLFRKNDEIIAVVENFNDHAITFNLEISGSKPHVFFGIPEFTHAAQPDGKTTLAARSLFVLKNN